jgi:hypothetical protein
LLKGVPLQFGATMSEPPLEYQYQEYQSLVYQSEAYLRSVTQISKSVVSKNQQRRMAFLPKDLVFQQPAKSLSKNGPQSI